MSLDRLLDALERERAGRRARCESRCQRRALGRDQNLAGRRLGFEPGSQINGAADGGENPRMSANTMVAVADTCRCFLTRRKARSQIVQMFGFILLWVMPKIRNGTASGPRIGIGTLI